MASERGRIKIERGQKRVRGYLKGELVFDTTEPLLVWEAPYFPTYYIPQEDAIAALSGSGETKRMPSRGIAELLDVKVSRVAGTEAEPLAAYPSPDLIAKDLEEAAALVPPG